jgi:hypothetical protein
VSYLDKVQAVQWDGMSQTASAILMVSPMGQAERERSLALTLRGDGEGEAW